MTFFAELRRRNVVRVAIAYAVVFWLVTQVVTTIEEPLGLPDWFDTAAIVLLAIGFPIALLFSWAFELTPQGLKPTAEVDRDTSVTHNTGKKLNVVISVALVLALGFIAWDKLGPGAGESAAAPETPVLAVLPFANMSGIVENEYFSDGISEELLNAIVRMNLMDVIGRTSSFQFKGQNLDLREIGRTLNATHILEGSVRRDGDRVRITAQLVEAKNGLHLWSDTYDRNLVDVLAVQTEVADAIAKELKLTLSSAAPDEAIRVSNSEAFDLYLRVRAALREHSFASVENATNWADRAIRLDPDFALLYVAKAEVLLDKARIGMLDGKEAALQALPLLDIAAEKGAGSAADWFRVRGTAWRELGDSDQAEADFRSAYELSPNDTLVAAAYASALPSDRAGTLRRIEILQRVMNNDPLDNWIPFGIGNAYARLLEFDKAERYMQKSLEINPEAPTPSAFYGLFLANTGRLAKGIRQLGKSASLDAVDPESFTFPAQAHLSLGDYDQAIALAQKAIAVAPKRADAVYLEEAARYADAASDEERDVIAGEIDARLAAVTADPETLFRRIGTGVESFRAYLALQRGEPERALREFLESTPESSRQESTSASEDDGSLSLGYFALEARLHKLAGQEQRAADMARQLAWITEDVARDRFGGALNANALWFLVETRAGFVPDAQVLGWIDQLHELGAFYDWRARLKLNPGYLMIEDRDGLAAVIAKFEASMAAARADLAAGR